MARRRQPMTRGERVCAFLEAHCVVPEGMLVGQPLKLAPFQVRFFTEVYDNPAVTRRAYLSIARKNAKTATIAGLVLAHLTGPEAIPNSEIVSGARSREQAGQVYRYASKMAAMSPTLRDLVRPIPSKKTLIGLNRNVEYHAIAAEAGTAHGGSPVVAILDEVGQIRGPQDDFVDAIETSQGAYDQPLLIAISTQAPTDNDLFSIWLDDARDSKDPQIVCHLYTAPPTAGLMDEDGWRAANPALGLFRSEKDVLALAEKAVRMPSSENTFRNLILNQRVSTASPFVSRGVWESCGQAPADLDPELPVWAALDLSARTDLTALVIVQDQGEPGTPDWQVWPYFWAPTQGLAERSRRDRVPYELWAREGHLRTTPGATVDYEVVAQELAELLEDLTVAGVAFDRWRMDVLQKELDRIGVDLPLVPFGQGYKSMSPALDAMEADLLNGRLAHGMHPVLTMCAMNSVVSRDPAGNRKLDKGKANGRIDGMVALTMARGVAEVELPEQPSVYETRGVLEIEV